MLLGIDKKKSFSDNLSMSFAIILSAIVAIVSLSNGLKIIISSRQFKNSGWKNFFSSILIKFLIALELSSRLELFSGSFHIIQYSNFY